MKNLEEISLRLYNTTFLNNVTGMKESFLLNQFGHSYIHTHNSKCLDQELMLFYFDSRTFRLLNKLKMQDKCFVKKFIMYI